jgi:hypothetical protein
MTENHIPMVLAPPDFCVVLFPDLSHLRGLRRLSPCCRARVAHPYSIRSRSCDRALALICLSCRMSVNEHELWNNRGERVWPVELPPGPPPPRRKRIRRQPTEAEPVSYPLHIPATFLWRIK